jgi:carbamoyl-phosphate synthase small subunit
MENEKKAVLLLEDGSFFEGISVGAKGSTVGEICFNTGMTGYQEIFTDPSYFGQILVTATAHIGNYGVEPTEIESEGVKIAGLVCKKFSHTFSRPAANDSLQNYFEQHGLVGISDIDTRKLVRLIRTKGAMNAIISSEIFDLDALKNKLSEAPNMDGLALANKVSTETPYLVSSKENKFTVALIDFGVKTNIIRSLVERGCNVHVFPYNAQISDILRVEPDGIMLSNGPGDPKAMPNEIQLVRDILGIDIPVFGICLGHQLLSLALGLDTIKMHHGHRGINHPIINLITGKCEITSQNHGFVVDFDSVKNNDNVEVTHKHLNDGTLAGIRLKDKPVFSVQYHPEAGPGPNDSKYLFDNFIENIKTRNLQTV